MSRIFVCFLLLACASIASAGAVPLRVSVAYGIAGDHQRVPPASAFSAIDATALLPTLRPDGMWVRVQPASGTWASPQPLILSLRAYQGTVTLSIPGAPSVTTSPRDMRTALLHGHGRIAFALPANLPAQATLQLHFAPYKLRTKPITIAVQTLSAFTASDAHWLAWVSACLAAIALTALLAVFFAVVLRDPAFVYYAACMLSFLLLQMLQTGYMYHPLGLRMFASANVTWTLLNLGLSLAFASVFLTRFTDMRRLAPRLRVVTLICGWAVCAILAMAALPNPAIHEAFRLVMFPAMAIYACLVVVFAGIMLIRGSRHASVFLLGWIPLLGLTITISVQPYAALTDWAWAADGGIVAGTFEAIVLSLGLADRVRMMRRERDSARVDADTDPLTGAINRRLWQRHAEALVSKAHASGQPLSILFIDIDHFKELNDQYGHHVGDRALGTLVDFLHGQLRENDLLGRYGGDEFIVALPGCDADSAKRMGERLRRGIERLYRHSGENMGALTTSIGCAELHAGESAQSLLERADKAMYSAKTSGRNRVVHTASIVSIMHPDA